MRLQIGWVRQQDDPDFKQPATYLVLGQRGSGKSSLLECLGYLHLKQAGSSLVDLFGSRDNESLAWLRAKELEGSKILLLRSPNVSISSSWEDRPVPAVQLSDFQVYDLIISAPAFYTSFDEEASLIGELVDRLYTRHSWRRPCYLLIREASNLLYSRLRVAGEQVRAKSQLIYLLREARHAGLTLGLDSIRFSALDVDVRSVIDYLIIKNLGLLGLPDDLEWLYSYFEPSALRTMAPQYFVIVLRTGALGLGRFSLPPWHKHPGEDLLAQLNIRVERGEPEHREASLKVSVADHEHAQIVGLYHEGNSMEAIARQVGRSTRTVHRHIHLHNSGIQRNGFCLTCRRARSPLEAQILARQINQQ